MAKDFLYKHYLHVRFDYRWCDGILSTQTNLRDTIIYDYEE